jgi:chromosome segregation ATPase
MDAIRKKMQSLKGETESMYATIQRFEDATKEYQARADQADCDLRDYGKKVQNLEIGFDETNDKLQKATETLEEKEKMFKEVESDVSALSRRIMLMEEEAKKSETNLADTVTKLAISSKEADTILKAVKVVESLNMNNEVTLEELDKNLRSTIKMESDNEQKLDEVTRKLGVQECELKRGIERAELAEGNLKKVEEELEKVGEHMKVLENSATKALEKEEKLVEKILQLQQKYKTAETRFEYGEMNITKLNHTIDDIEDEIYREKLKIKHTANELSDTFDDMLENY